MKKLGVATLFFLSFAVFAATVTVNASNPPYNTLSNVVGTNIYSEVEIRMAGGFQILGAYNTLNPNNRLGAGDQIQVKWQDGSSERLAVSNPMVSAGVTPVPGTQQSGSGSSGSGGGPYDDGSGYDPGNGGLGGTPYEDCFSDTVKACVSVGGEPMQCETIPVLNCPP